MPTNVRVKRQGRLSRKERIILEPAERRETVLQLIRSARKRLILSIFRCDDFQILDELGEALQRKVRVEALITRRARGGKKRLKQLWAFLESMGASVHRYADPVVKYHAKYIVADDGPALIASLNLTRKCFETTCDFLLTTYDPAVVSGLKRLFEADCQAPDSSLPEHLNNRLIIGPERARDQFAALLEQARRSVRIIDHKLTDPAMLALLKAQSETGVDVSVLGRGQVGTYASHGKMMLIDERVAAIGSLSLSALSLDFRREVSVIVRDRRCVSQLNGFFQSLTTPRTAKSLAFRKGSAS